MKQDGSGTELNHDMPHVMFWMTPPSDEVTHVIERIRGQFNSIKSGETDVIPAVMYAWIGPRAMLNDADGNEISAGSAQPNFPDITDDSATDDFMLVQDACIPTNLSGAESRSPNFPVIDTKSKRKIGRDEVLFFLLRLIGTSTGTAPGSSAWIQLIGHLRVLLKAVP